MYSRFLNIFRFNRIFWWIICLLLVSNIVFFMVVRTRQDNRINELHRTYNEKRISPSLNNKDIGQAPLLQAMDDIDSFKNSLPERKDFAETAAELFSILKRRQVETGKTVYKPESIDYNGLIKYATSLSLKGSYPAIKAVLADIQESRSLFCIESLSISVNPGDGPVEMDIKIATYFR